MTSETVTTGQLAELRRLFDSDRTALENRIRLLEQDVVDLRQAQADRSADQKRLAEAGRGRSSAKRTPYAGIGKLDRIITVVAGALGIQESQLRRKGKENAIGRHLVMYLAQELTTLSQYTIGRALGGLDHTSVINGRQRTEERRRHDQEFDALVSKLAAEVIATATPRPSPDAQN